MGFIPSYKGKIVVVTVVLDKSLEHDPSVNLEYRETIRSSSILIDWAPNHVVFTLADRSVIAYRANNVIEVYTEYEND